MKRTIILSALLLYIYASAYSQTIGIDQVLSLIEVNNKELQANEQLVNMQKLENKADNNLSDPSLSYSHLWGEKNSGETIGELVVSQSFDFPTLYAARGKMNRLKEGAINAQSTAFRQQMLLQAKEICLDIIMLQQQQTLLDQRLKQAEELSIYYKKRLEEGDANILESNKINLELLNVRTEARTNSTNLHNKWQELTALNSNQPLQFSVLSEYPLCPLPTNYEQLRQEVVAADANLQSLNSESDAAHKQISVSKQGWLPKLELGYRRNTESGTPFNGIVAGFSFPIFENRNKVKIAKAQAMNVDFRKENSILQAESALAQLYHEASSLHTSMQEYREAFASQQDLALLKQALTGGQISVIEYFVEVTIIYQSKQNLIQLENQYQKVMAQIYKGRL